MGPLAESKSSLGNSPGALNRMPWWFTIPTAILQVSSGVKFRVPVNGIRVSVMLTSDAAVVTYLYPIVPLILNFSFSVMTYSKPAWADPP